MLFTFQVRQTEIGIITTFGKFSRTIDQPGFNWRLPYPIQNLYRFDNRIYNFERKFEQATTGDGINLLMTVYAGWRVADPRVYLESLNGDELKAEQALEPLLRNAKTGTLSQHVFSDLVNTNANDLKYDQIEQEMLSKLQNTALTKYGIEIKMLGIKQIGLPESITTKVFARMKEERKTIATQFRADGEKEAKIKRAWADNQANRILSEARAKAIEISGGADAAASEYYLTMQQNPDLAKFIFQRNALEQSLKERTHIDTRSTDPAV